MKPITPDLVAQMFPGARLANIEANLPHVLTALAAAHLDDLAMALMALATIRVETAGFRPINEGVSRFNTSPGGKPFDLYDKRADLGNQGPPDGERFRGRGFIQLTGRANYLHHGVAIGLGSELVESPDRANEPATAAQLLASFLKAKEPRIRAALAAGDLAKARKLVNGGSHGLPEFTAAYRTGEHLFA